MPTEATLFASLDASPKPPSAPEADRSPPPRPVRAAVIRNAAAPPKPAPHVAAIQAAEPGTPSIPRSTTPQQHDALVDPDDPILITEREAAKVLCISPRKLWDLRQQGDVPHIRLGRAVRYSRRDLAAWIDAQACSRGNKTSTHS